METKFKNSTELFKTILHTYLQLQKIANRDVKFAVHTDTIRASLRNAISEECGMSDFEVQSWCEQNAIKYYGKDTWPLIVQSCS